METDIYRGVRLGVLGGGQLGRMLIQAGTDFDISFAVLDPSRDAPCRSLAEFTTGQLTDYDTVVRFGKNCDVVTIELENVNTAALAALQREGKKVFPQPRAIEIIRDKRSQKQFFKDHNIPTSPFFCIQNRREAMDHASFLPAVNKLATAGYDGRGVQIIHEKTDLSKVFDAPGLLEKWIPIDKELSVIVARNQQGDVVAYPPVEMGFHPEENILEHVFAPACISAETEKKVLHIARQLIDALNMTGVLAVELFLTHTGEILVNEVAPRPHNSGHHTIEACITSQYEQHLRAILNLPMGSVKMHMPCAMINLMGHSGQQGPAGYQGLQEVFSMNNAHIHLYGKSHTKPFRKMGHVTILDKDIEHIKDKINFVKKTCHVIT